MSSFFISAIATSDLRIVAVEQEDSLLIDCVVPYHCLDKTFIGVTGMFVILRQT